MLHTFKSSQESLIETFEEFVRSADYSFMKNLNADPESTAGGIDHRAREVLSGHFVPVTPTPLPDPAYVSHSKALFEELGLDNDLTADEKFIRLFSGDISAVDDPMQRVGWATGYALSIYGTEYTQQCPFGTGNGYGDGRAISVYEGVLKGRRWEMQLKGAGPTPYRRRGDGRAVLRSSIREFLAQEHMHALGVPTSRSLTLFASSSETVTRPWYSEGSSSIDPDVLISEPVAISTRVAPSFIRVGQLELFARRARGKVHPRALEELHMIVRHLIEREYKDEIDQSLGFPVQLIELAKLYCKRLTSLVANWLRVGYCQGNFNSDNCAGGGFTLDYGPFGFCEKFNPEFQPWTGGGRHFSFFNQPDAAKANYDTFCFALRPLFEDNSEALRNFDQIRGGFTEAMRNEIQSMWTAKLGLLEYEPELVQGLLQLMVHSEIDYTILFRELSNIPQEPSDLKKSFYSYPSPTIEGEWKAWMKSWRNLVLKEGNLAVVARRMKRTNPKYTWREWLVAPAYQQAMNGDYRLVRELQKVYCNPYDDQTEDIETKFYRLKPDSYFGAGGISHYSCSS